MAEETPNSNSKIISVDIYDQTYHLRGQDVERIQALARMVDGKMRAVAERGATVDSLRVAVLAALNIADELASVSERYRALIESQDQANTMRSKASSLSGLLDSVLDGERRIG